MEAECVVALGTMPRRLGSGFEGRISLYLHQGQLAFFRRRVIRAWEQLVEGNWECTGFITDLSWAPATGKCRKLTPCLVFSNGGAYHVSISCLGNVGPPVRPARNAMAYEGCSS